MAKEIKMQGQYQPADATANNDERMRDAVQLKKQMVALMTTNERVEFIGYFNAIAETMGKVEEYGKKCGLITDDEFGHIMYAKQYFRQLADIIESASDEETQE